MALLSPPTRSGVFFFIARMLENAKVAVKWKKNCCFHRRKLFCMYKNGAIDAD
jgi:hypothetical protein